MDAASRFRAWMGLEKLNQTKAAELLGCSPSWISRIWNGTHAPERDLAVAIEAATKGSPLGQLRVSDWSDFEPTTASDSAPRRRASGEARR